VALLVLQREEQALPSRQDRGRKARRVLEETGSHRSG
jgi:hypothetical protein